MSSPEFTLLFITVAVGALLQVAIGFGLGLLAAPVIAVFDPSLTPVAVLLLATGVTAAVLVLEGGHLDLRGAGWALAGRVPGVLGGAALVAVLPARYLALLVAAVVVTGVAVSLRGFVPAPRRRSVLLARPMSSRLDMRRTRAVAMVLAVASATVLVVQQFV
ncbi:MULTISPECIES: TSUP family transporter [Streptomyces violaceusniger group]|uniref:Probable membrane transporter protein n=2 Tax=Streptomyces rhizosphaericus TaxID=114699 RepID=A0ABN1S1S6_9ACTN|nr:MULTISPECIES: TSUP family transporter [Streptomyces violaceusniger group]